MNTIHPQPACPSACSFLLRSLIKISTCLIALVYSQLSAQLAPSPTVSNNMEQEVTVLNPFVVTTSGDVGYQAQESLSGSRLSSKLADMAVPVTAFTQELLQDIGRTNVDDLVEYMVNTRTDHPEAENIYWGADSIRFRIRGLPAFNYSVNFFKSTLRLDLYNTERVEQSRGPNSILFGLGSPGGVVNVATKKSDPRRAFGSLTQVFSSNNGNRTVLDLNHPLVDKKLSLRLIGVRDYKDTWRRHEYDNQERLFATAAWQPTRTTRVDVEWEHGHVDKSLALPNIGLDYYTPWAQAGKHLSNTANSAFRVGVISGADRLSIDTATGEVRNVRGTTRSTANQVDGVQVYFSDFSLVPKEVVLANGPAFPQATDYTRGTAIVSHEFTPNLNLEIAANYQKSNHNNIIGVSGMRFIQVDTTATINGLPNPNAGRPFVEGALAESWENNLAKEIRASLAYKLDLGRWGTHDLAGMYQRSFTWLAGGTKRPMIVVNPFNRNTPENVANGVNFRTYYDFDGSPGSMNAGDLRRFDISRIDDHGVIRETRVINTVQGSQDSKFETDSAIGVLQSRFWKNRLITVAGYRIDWQDSYYSPTGYRGAPFGPFTLGAYETPRSDTPVKFKATNLTFSGLYRLTRSLALTYNQAENSALPDPAAAVIREDGSDRPPPPRGRSRDAGLKVDLGSRLSLSFLRYETEAKKDTANVIAGIESNYRTIWDALDAANVAAPGGGRASEVQSLFNRYTFDSSARGYEMEVIANPTKNWRAFFNASMLKLERTNIGQEGIAYLEKYRDYWLQGNNGRILINGSGGLAPVANDQDNIIETVAEQIEAIDRNIYNSYTLGEGEQPRGQNKWQLNLRTNYGFDVGILKGFSLGGGARYRSPEVIAYEIVDTGTTVEKNVVRGDEQFLVDCNLGYRGQFKLRGGRNVRWSLQLNINNLLDETDILPMYAVNGVVVRYRFQPPREFFLTTKFEL